MADFTGFSYNGVHSSELGLTVVSNGSRFSKNLLPSFKDITTTVEGRHGNYFYGSTYEKYTFTISTAFADLHEEQLRKIQRLFHKQELCELIFDEYPYKVYSAKLAQEPRLNFICFDGPVRIYKGELDLSFICYFPFARSQYRYLHDYRVSDNHYVNVDEWAWASNMKEIQGDYDEYIDGKIKVFNAGDLDADYLLRFTRAAGVRSVDIDINGSSYTLTFPSDNSDLQYDGIIGSGIIEIDTNKHLITQALVDPRSGGAVSINVVNHYLSNGRLELIPEEEALFTFTVHTKEGIPPTDIYDVTIDYNHLYL